MQGVPRCVNVYHDKVFLLAIGTRIPYLISLSSLKRHKGTQENMGGGT